MSALAALVFYSIFKGIYQSAVYSATLLVVVPMYLPISSITAPLLSLKTTPMPASPGLPLETPSVYIIKFCPFIATPSILPIKDAAAIEALNYL